MSDLQAGRVTIEGLLPYLSPPDSDMTADIAKARQELEKSIERINKKDLLQSGPAPAPLANGVGPAGGGAGGQLGMGGATLVLDASLEYDVPLTTPGNQKLQLLVGLMRIEAWEPAEQLIRWFSVSCVSQGLELS